MDGTYIGLKFTEASKKTILSIIEMLQIKKPINLDDLHLTLIYSLQIMKPYKPLKVIKDKIIIKDIAIWPTGNDKHALVLIVHSNYLIDKHNELISTYDGVHSFPSYIPHITLSLDIDPEIEISYEVKKRILNQPLMASHEYVEALKPGWTSSLD